MKYLKQQLFPLFLIVVIFFFLVALLNAFVHILNIFPIHEKITYRLLIPDIAVGTTIYLKTAIDFALFMGGIMRSFPGWKNRIAIEIGTALGNGIGTLLILCVWTFFKEIPLLLGATIILASLVLFHLAENSLLKLSMHYKLSVIKNLITILHWVNRLSSPIVSHIFPKRKIVTRCRLKFLPLLIFSFTIPFVLGLDDFAGYIPLFSIVNVIGFITGVFFGHALLNTLLFASPRLTTRFVSLPLILFLGGIAFIALGAWGFVESAMLLFRQL